MNNFQFPPHYLQFQNQANDYINNSRGAIIASANEFINANNATAANEAATRCAREISILGARLDNLYECDAICSQIALAFFYNESLFGTLKEHALQKLNDKIAALGLGDQNENVAPSDDAMSIDDTSDDDFDLSMNDVQLAQFQKIMLLGQKTCVENNDNKVIVTVVQESMKSILSINQMHEHMHPKSLKPSNGATTGINQLFTLLSKGLYEANIFKSLAPRVVSANYITRQPFGDGLAPEETIIDDTTEMDPILARRRANINRLNALADGALFLQ